jgi:hypothetical protein
LKPRISDLPKFITEPSTGCFQARVQRAGRYRSASFSVSKYGTRQKAIKMASKWAQQTDKELGLPDNGRGLFRTRCRADKRSPLPVGVWQTVAKRLNRDGTVNCRLVYAVCYSPPGQRQKIRTFSAGSLETPNTRQAARAKQTAIAFRRHWEYSRLHNLAFDPAHYDDWLTDKMYPFKGQSV